MTQSDSKQESTANVMWSRMLQGSRRFAEGRPDYPWQDKEARQTLPNSQNPDAAVLSCSDSRVSPEIISDQDLGGLFTMRTAEQLIDSAVITSLEYAVKKLHVNLICALDHEHCDAVEAAEQGLGDLIHTITSEADGSPEVADTTDDSDEHITAAEPTILYQTGIFVWQAREVKLDAYEDTERAHVAHIIETLVEQPPVIQQALTASKLMIVDARYQLDSGRMEVLSF